MSFLTAVPQDWTRPELRELRDLSVLAYRRSTAAEQLADAVGIVPGTFPLHDNMRTTWTELIKELGKQGKLEAVVQKMANDPAAAAYASRFRDLLSNRPAVERPQPAGPSSDWWQGDDRSPSVASTLYPERLMERRSRLLDIGLARQITAAARSVVKLDLRFGVGPAYGTGFLIDQGHVLTNYHNVFDADLGAVSSVVAKFDFEQGFAGSGIEVPGAVSSIIGDPTHDWAVIELETPVDRPTLKIVCREHGKGKPM